MYFSVYFSTEVLSVDGYRWIQTPSVIQDFGVCGDTLPPKRNQTGPWFFETKVSARVNFDVLPTFEEMPKVPMMEAFPPASLEVSAIYRRTCGRRNVYIHHGFISHLRGLVQMRTKENKGQKQKNFSSPNVFPALFQCSTIMLN